MKTVNKLLDAALSTENENGKRSVKAALESLGGVATGYRKEIDKQDLIKRTAKAVEALKTFHPGNVSLEAAANDLLLKMVNADGPQASMEGLNDFFKGVRHFFSSKKPGEKIKNTKWNDAGYNKVVVGFNKSIKDFYTNDSWLKSQYFVTGEIECSDFIKCLAIGDTVGKDVYKDVMGFEAPFKKLHAGYVDDCNRYAQELSMLFNDTYNKQHANSKSGNDNKESEKIILDEFLAAVKKVEVPSVGGSSFGCIGGYVVTPVADKAPKIEQVSPKGELPTTLPALTKEQVKEMAKLMLVMGRWLERSCFLFVEMFVDEDECFQEDFLKYNSLPEELEEICDVGLLWYNVQCGVFDLYANILTVMGALESWIDRSIK
jgi:hypothetical protein